jgi:hypothetical protein
MRNYPKRLALILLSIFLICPVANAGTTQGDGQQGFNSLPASCAKLLALAHFERDNTALSVALNALQ